MKEKIKGTNGKWIIAIVEHYSFEVNINESIIVVSCSRRFEIYLL